MAVGVPGTPIATIVKDPDAKLDYSIKWASWLAGDTITASAWTVPAGITEATPAASFTDTVATIWLSGGTPGTSYDLVNSITTAATRVDNRTIRIEVKER